jgi:4-hydroxybenzoyl-CoA reductase subunit alpha
MNQDYQVVGKSTPNISARDKVTGRAQYADDLRVKNPLFIRILRSSLASAKILAVDIEKAKQVPGVRSVLVGCDFHRTFGVLPISKDEPALAKDRVRYMGEPVAAVAAETPEQAYRAMALIKVQYEETEECLTWTEGMKKTENQIHPELKRETNLHKAVRQEFGNVEDAFKNAPIVVEDEFSFKAVTHAFTEPHAVQVEIDADQNLTVYSSTQVPHYVHLTMAEVLEVPAEKIRVVKPHLGGGFGGKGDPFPHEMIAAKFALLTGRNTRLLLSREEVFFSNHGRHPTDIKMKLAFDPEEGLKGLAVKVSIDGGAYASFGVVTTYYNGVLLNGPYHLPNYLFECDRVYTNKPMSGAMRGHGGVNPRFASEVLLDMACVKAEIDPCEARLRYFLKENSLTVNQFRVTSNSITEGLRLAMQRSDWKNKYGKLPHGKGIGVACGFFISGSGLPIHWNGLPQSTVRLTVDFDGSVTLFSGASDIGQGSDTMMAQMAAEVLGLPIAMIRVVSADTRLCPVDLGSYSSRVTFMAGNAARNAAISMRRLLVVAAAQLLDIPVPAVAASTDTAILAPEPRTASPGGAATGAATSGITTLGSASSSINYFKQGQKPPVYSNGYLGPNPDYQDGFVFKGKEVIAPNGKTLKYLEVVNKALVGVGILQSTGSYTSPKMGGDFKGAGAGLSPSYSFTAFITEVTVDTQTGFIKVDKVTAAHDCGFQLNPMAVEGQIEGSIHMGLGQALMEDINYEGGAVQNASFLEYKIPSPFEQPVIDIVPLNRPDNEGPFGAKEVGEGSLAPILPSVANAVYDAVGIRLKNLPMTPDQVLAALKAKEATARENL